MHAEAIQARSLRWNIRNAGWVIKQFPITTKAHWNEWKKKMLYRSQNHKVELLKSSTFKTPFTNW